MLFFGASARLREISTRHRCDVCLWINKGFFYCFQPFLLPPVILVTPSHQIPERLQDAMAVWMEDWRKDGFKICLKESKIFDGVHKNIEVVSIVTLAGFI